MRNPFLFLLLFFVTDQFAQTPLLRTGDYYSSRTFNEENGLNQKFIFSISQNDNGVLFLGTEKGLVSFNGDQFVSKTKADGLSEDEVSCIFTDSHDVTWIGSFHKGISRYTRGVLSIRDSSIHERVAAFAEDHNGGIWGACDGRGAFCIPRSDKQPVFVEGGTTITGPMAFDSLGQLIAANAFGLGIYSCSGTNISLQTTLPETQGKKVDALCIGKLYGREVLIAGIENEGMWIYVHEKNKYQPLVFIGAELGYSDFIFSAIACDRNNDVWVASFGEGLRRVPVNHLLVPGQVENYSGLPDDNIRSLLVDMENNLWIGTFGHGLVELPASVFRFYTQQNGLTHPEVRCVTKDKLGRFWLGNNDGITCFYKDGKTPAEFFDQKNGFVTAAVNCLETDSSGRIWIGTSQGIFRLDPQSRSFENISAKHQLESKNVNSITINKTGLVFFGTTDGLYIYNDSSGEFRYLTTMDGLMHNNIQHLFSDKYNNTWISSAGTPPYFMRNDEITVFQQVDKLRGYNINGVCEDSSGTYWIASDGDGVFAYNGESFRQYNTANGLRNSNCLAVTADTSGVIWVLHRNGISMKFPGDTVFLALNGVENRMFYNINPAVYQDNDHVIYFCSANGLIEILPQHRSYLRRLPHLSLAHFFVNGNEQVIRPQYSFGPGVYNLTFEFNNILFSVPGRPPFYYRLIGADSTWQQVNGRSIIIPNLSSGNYLLQVSSTPSFGPGALGIEVFIDRPFYEKSWFRWMVVFSAPLFVILLIRLQTLSLRKNNRRLQVLVTEKTALLQEEKEAVSRINAELQSKNKDITDSIHYAERIQLAILPDISILKEQFPESFIFFLPRDIVSGDFYWFAQKDDLFITAAVDCTGHGIPGAFMSMIGSTLLNKIVFDYNITKASEILTQLDREVTASLHQRSEDATHDGMDIALCVFDKGKKQVAFAGAGRPLYLVRHGEVLIYKSAKAGIGGGIPVSLANYSEEIIPLEENDMLYIFSDGYCDQFSEAFGVKFSSRRLRELIATIGHLSAQEQHKIIRETFFKWKGNELQFDDVLMMGMKISWEF